VPEGTPVDRKLVVVMPAYNAEATLERTWRDLPRDPVDEIILVDDGSADRTAEIAVRLGLTVIQHQRNRGYGANQKTCYRVASSAEPT
jgi:glycosyltransferase involved in cell wall biosynthesis